MHYLKIAFRNALFAFFPPFLLFYYCNILSLLFIWSPSVDCNLFNHHSLTHTFETKTTSCRYGFFTISYLKKHLDRNIGQSLFILTVRDVRSMLCSVAKGKFQTTLKKCNNMHINALNIVHRWQFELNGYLDGQTKTETYNYLKMRTEKLKTEFAIVSRVKHGVVTMYVSLIHSGCILLQKIKSQFYFFQNN